MLVCAALLLTAVCCIIHGDAHAGNMLWDASQQRLTLIDLPTMLAATKVKCVEDADTDADAVEQPGKIRLVALHTSPAATESPSASPLRHSAACPHPASLVLHGCALAGRDVSHFERKLDSFGSQAGMTHEEVTQMRDTFHSTYVDAGGVITDAASRFFAYRSLLGEVTQLVRHDPRAIKSRIIEQLQQMTKHDAISD
jgi:hypothetical protein